MKEFRNICILTAFGFALATAFAQSVQLNIGLAGYACGRVTTRNYCNLPAVVVDTNGNNIRSTTITLNAEKQINLAGQVVGSGYVTVDGVEYKITTPWASIYAPSVLSYDFINEEGTHGGHINVPTSTYKSSGGGGKGGGGAGTYWIALHTSTLSMF